MYFGGVGYHIPYLERFRPDAVVIWGKYLVAISSLYFWTVNIPKIAILALYHRLFPNKTIRRTVYLLVGALVVQTLATGTTAFAACRPFAANWDPKIPGSYCIDKEGLFRWASFPNIITDIIILVLPMRTIWHLQTSRRLKFGLIATFAVGSLSVFAQSVCDDANKVAF